MATGIQLRCADGVERLCFPVLCQHIGDMEEQWLLACMKRPACPKCRMIDPSASLHNPSNRSPRTDKDAFHARFAFENNDINYTTLLEMDYHPDQPYSSLYPFNGILDALGPDLLHQVSKCFHDYVMEKFIWPFMEHHWKSKGVAAKELRKEIN